MKIGAAMTLALVIVAFEPASLRAADAPLTVSQLVEIAIEANLQVRSARYRWDAAAHSIKQTIAPNDPVFTYTNSDSVKSPVGRAALREFNVSESFQFLGKALHQRDLAVRSAEIAHLMLVATVRDVRAATETAYFQLVLDSALAGVNDENLRNLDTVVRVAETAYSGSKVAQTDVISSEFDLAAARQLQRQYETAQANDLTVLNLLLNRPVGSPLSVDRTLRIEALNIPLDALIDRAYAMRQEILGAALAERNMNTALYLAKMEYLPDFTVAVQYDDYLVPSFAPKPSQKRDWVGIIGFNMPIFFWLKQDEDVARAKANLQVARSDLALIRMQTAAAVATLFRSAQFAYESTILYRDSLIPLAQQNFRVALTAYQSGKIDFVTLSGVLQRNYAARVSYLQAANQFLAGQVSLEQAIGAPLHQ
jgi:outer membrane protein TolC